MSAASMSIERAFVTTSEGMTRASQNTEPGDPGGLDVMLRETTTICVERTLDDVALVERQVGEAQDVPGRSLPVRRRIACTRATTSARLNGFVT